MKLKKWFEIYDKYDRLFFETRRDLIEYLNKSINEIFSGFLCIEEDNNSNNLDILISTHEEVETNKKIALFNGEIIEVKVDLDSTNSDKYIEDIVVDFLEKYSIGVSVHRYTGTFISKEDVSKVMQSLEEYFE